MWNVPRFDNDAGTFCISREDAGHGYAEGWTFRCAGTLGVLAGAMSRDTSEDEYLPSAAKRATELQRRSNVEERGYWAKRAELDNFKRTHYVSARRPAYVPSSTRTVTEEINYLKTFMRELEIYRDTCEWPLRRLNAEVALAPHVIHDAFLTLQGLHGATSSAETPQNRHIQTNKRHRTSVRESRGL